MIEKPLALLVVPPVYDFALFDLFIKPYSLLKLGKVLQDSGYRVHLVNALDYREQKSIERLGRPPRKSNGTGKFFRQITAKPGILRETVAGNPDRDYFRYGIIEEVFAERLRAREPDVALVFSGMTYWYPGVQEAVGIIRNSFPRVPVILGGIYASLCTEHAVRFSGADFVVSGAAFPRLGEILASLGLPLPRAGYNEEMLSYPEISAEAGVIRINRGCPFNCSYCASRVLSGPFRPGRPGNALQAVIKLHQFLGTRNFAFYDDALLADKEKGIIPFLEGVISSGLALNFYIPNGVHLRFLDYKVAGLMKLAGFREIRMGFESSDLAFHRESGNKLEVPMLAPGIKILKSAGFRSEEINVYILVGLPGQYREEVEESIAFAMALGLRVRLASYSPVPGTALWEKSIRLSPLPLTEDPLTHNNTLLPLQWPGLDLNDLRELKALARAGRSV